MKKLIVVGGMIMFHGKQRRVIAADYTKKAIREKLQLSVTYFRDYCGVTANKEELRVATRPGIWVFGEKGNSDLILEFKTIDDAKMFFRQQYEGVLK